MVKPKTDRRLRPIEKADLKLASKLALDPDDSPNRAVSRFAELGDQPPLRVLCGATIVAGAVNRDRTLFRTGLRMLAAHQFATLAKSLVKDVVDRSRPGEALDSRRYKMAPGTSKDHRLQSMPSGHSAGVVAVTGAAIAGYPAVAIPAVAASGAIMAAQLPSRNHFLSDVAAGAAIGLAGFALARLILPPVERARPAPL